MKKKLVLGVGFFLVLAMIVSVTAFSWPWEATGKVTDEELNKKLTITQANEKRFNFGGKHTGLN